MAMHNETSAGTGKSRSVLLIFIGVCIAVGAVCFQYYSRLHTTIRSESSGYLQEVARRTGSNVDRILMDNYAVLYTMESVMESMNVSSFSEVSQIVATQMKYWNYQSIMLIDENGKAYNSDGREVHLNADTTLREAMLSGQQSMSTTQMVDNRECILFAIPLHNLQMDGRRMVALAAAYDPASFNEVLSMTSFDGQAYAQIVSSDGTVVIRPSQHATMKTGYNVLTSIENAKMDSGSTVSDIRSDMALGRAGHSTFTMDGLHTYMVYTPLSQADWYLITFVPVSVVNARSDMILRITLVLCGAITLLFAGLLVLMIQIFTKHRQQLEKIAFVDEITGGHTIQRFYQLAQAALDAPDRPQYALVFTNLEKFKVLNEQFGRRICDSILVAFNEQLGNMLRGRECMGRISADNFCILLEFVDIEEMTARFECWHSLSENFIRDNRTTWGLPVTEFGVYIIENDAIPFPQMIDRAKLSLRASPRTLSSKVRYAIYNDEVRRSLFREKQLEDWMDRALHDQEFQVYLQPKYRTQDETIGGAEALCRWVSTEEGMIYPDEFIPLFEKNGFIVQLDLWVFEKVCATVRRWLDEGKTPIKVSVNCSRIHLQDQHFLVAYRKITRQYNIPDGLLEIELTESVVLQDSKRLTQVIDDIHNAGLNCSMDDFGSGYSSLNLLQEIPVDTLKLDKIFFHSVARDPSRMESVVESIVRMAKALSMETVAEGVEHRDQVEMLKRMDCDLIQGYVFAKPMTIAAFEELAFPQS